MTMTDDGRLYRFGIDDRAGWLLGLQGPQCVAIAVGMFVAGVALNLGAPPLATLVPPALSLAVAFAPVAGRPVWAWLPIVTSWQIRRSEHSWRSPLPRFGPDGTRAASQTLPRILEGVAIVQHQIGWSPRGRSDGTVGVVRDDNDGALTMTIRVTGQGFALLERRDQDRLLGGWGDALAGCCRERSPVRSVRWVEWAAPAGVAEQLDYLERHRAPGASEAAVASYRELLARSGPVATRHETLVCVTVDPRKVRVGRSRRAESPTADGPERNRRDRDGGAFDALAEEVRLLIARLEAAGLVVEGPLGPGELAAVTRSRLDPFSAQGRSADRPSLSHRVGERAGSTVRPIDGPMATETFWDHVRVDRAFHTSLAITEWPRLDVPANWIEPLLLGGAAIRSVTVVLEPIPPSRAQRRVDRDSTRLTADAEQRDRSGFRIGARHRRAVAEVAEREAELVAGYAEFEFSGVITVTAPDLATLDRHAAESEQLAAQAGLNVRRLDGQHDVALPLCLPLSRGVATRRMTW